MATSNFERVGKAMELLRDGLAPFVEREVHDKIKSNAVRMDTLRKYAEDENLAKLTIGEYDVAALLKLMGDTWNEVFRVTLGNAERNLVFELKDWRNRWAHQKTMTSDDATRAMDSALRLLTAIVAPQAEELGRLKYELTRQVFDEQVRSEKRKAGGSLVEAAAAGGLKPWREVATPHTDVASGKYQQAEFAADLWQVHLGQGSTEYRDPKEFFRRTYLTASLTRLLTGGIQRINGTGGDPVVQLQTNFGGGKTHSMLALYHLFSGADPGELAGVDTVLAAAGTNQVPVARRVVLVGNRISPGNPVTKPDGTVVRTIWGELAWQLGGPAAFAKVAADDERATSPGDVLRQLFVEFGPCLILIDEWVAYARQLHDGGDLPGGSFETQFSFAQALTESAKAAGNCLLVVSLPASDGPAVSPHAQADDAEVGGVRGREALERLRNVIGRLESSWRPATAEEGFEIVRRRLFEPLPGNLYKARDVTAAAFAEFYKQQAADFPPECRDLSYENRIKAAYPIHPEVFDQLYGTWSTLVKFQRTRGVLRLMAAVIHCLWESGDRHPLIMPSTLPLDDSRVKFELTRYLPDNWTPIMERDVDGDGSLPARMDAQNPNLGKLSATRRVARTIFLGSAPSSGTMHRGIEDRVVKLGCAMPGESPAVFGDALRHLAGAATYLYADDKRYWYDTQPTVTKLAEDRAEQLKRDPDRVSEELARRIRDDVRKTGDFSRVHPMPKSGHDVPDDPETRLVILGVEHPYARDGGSPAEVAARAILQMRGNAPRLFQNSLVFLAVDQTRLQDLEEALRRFLAWRGILEEKDQQNLTPQQVRQAESQKNLADDTVAVRLPEAFMWLLVPVQRTITDKVELQAVKLATGKDPLAVRASNKLKADDQLVSVLGATSLRLEMDRVPLWSGNHVPIAKLPEFFARYNYLPRLKDKEVLLDAIRNGLALLTWDPETFAYAEAFDEPTGRYKGLLFGTGVTIRDASGPALLVRPEVATRQLDAERREREERERSKPQGVEPGGGPQADDKPPVQPGPGPVPPLPPQPPRRFYGSVELDPFRLGRDAGKIAEEVLVHLTGLVGASARITLEIEAEIPSGAPDHVVRTVTENARTLKFTKHGFEKE